jgi:hypothetical protein
MKSYRTARLYVTDSERSSENPTLLGLCFAQDPDTKSGLQAIGQPLSIKEASRRADQLTRRLNAHCKGLLEVHAQVKESNAQESLGDPPTTYDHTVS